MKSLPSVEYPPDWHITFIENHWSNEKAMIGYLRKFFSVILKKKEELKLDGNYTALVIFDRFKVQCTPNILSMLKHNNLHIAIVSLNCADRL